MKNELANQENEYIERFIKLWNSFKEHIKEMADVYVAMLDKWPGSKERLIAEIERTGAGISKQTLNRLEDVGRGRMHWRLMPQLGDIHESAKLRTLSFADQRDIIDNNKKFPLLLGSSDSILVDLKNCPGEQIEQIIDSSGGHIRDLSEQKLWLINTKNEENDEETRPPYKLKKRGLEIAGYIITPVQLKEIYHHYYG